MRLILRLSIFVVDYVTTFKKKIQLSAKATLITLMFLYSCFLTYYLIMVSDISLENCHIIYIDKYLRFPGYFYLTLPSSFGVQGAAFVPGLATPGCLFLIQKSILSPARTIMCKVFFCKRVIQS